MVAIGSNSHSLEAEVLSLEVVQSTSVANDALSTDTIGSSKATFLATPPSKGTEMDNGNGNAAAGLQLVQPDASEAPQLNGIANAAINSIGNFEITEHHGVKLVKATSTFVSCKDVDIIDAFIYSPTIPDLIKDDLSQPCVLGVDEAGRGPVLGK
jgi:hypothetical protein